MKAKRFQAALNTDFLLVALKIWMRQPCLNQPKTFTATPTPA